jgi:Na+-driven multidrug efflux pump
MTASTSTGAHPPAAPKPLWRSYLAFLGPMIFSNFLQSVSGTVNNIYLGQMLGVKAMAAVSAFFPVLFFLIAFMIGLGSGASVLIGQAWGARELDRVKAIAGTTLMTGLIAGLVVAVFGGSFADMMLVALGTPADILPGATAYARIMLIAAPGVFTFLLVTSMLRGVGDTRTPLLTLLISTAVGLLLTPALIRGWLGLPDAGRDQRRLGGRGVVPDRAGLDRTPPAAPGSRAGPRRGLPPPLCASTGRCWPRCCASACPPGCR